MVAPPELAEGLWGVEQEGPPTTRRRLDRLIASERARQELTPLPAPRPTNFLELYLEELEGGTHAAGALKALGDLEDLNREEVLQRLIDDTDDKLALGMPPDSAAWLRELRAEWFDDLRRIGLGGGRGVRFALGQESQAIGEPPQAHARPLSPSSGPALARAAPPGSLAPPRVTGPPGLAPGDRAQRPQAPQLRPQVQPRSHGSPPHAPGAPGGGGFAGLVSAATPPRADHAGVDDTGLAEAVGAALSAQLEPAIRGGLAPLGSVLDSIRRQNEDDKQLAEGSLGYLRGHARWWVFLARGCDQLTVGVCEGLLGRDLYDGLRRAGDGARALLTLSKWPVPINTRIAYGFAAAASGARDLDSAPEWTLTAADFWPVTQEAFDDFVPSSGHQREKKPKSPQTMAQWVRCADNFVRAFALVYGQEHAAERLEVRRALERMQEENHHEWPREEVWALWEELNWRWWEELKQNHRSLLRVMGTDNATKQDLAWFALAPGSDGQPVFRMPTTWDLELPDGYFQMVVLPRKQRKLTRSMWGMVHRKPAAAAKAGDGEEGAEEEAGAAAGGRGGAAGGWTGAAPKQAPKAKAQPKAAADANPYPAGKRLAAWEASNAMRNAPKDKDGRRLCWDFSTHQGCRKGVKDCPQSHRQITSTAGLPWECLAQLLRRGGLRNAPPVPPGEVDSRVEQLRSQAKAEKAAKLCHSRQAR